MTFVAVTDQPVPGYDSNNIFKFLSYINPCINLIFITYICIVCCSMNAWQTCVELLWQREEYVCILRSCNGVCS